MTQTNNHIEHIPPQLIVDLTEAISAIVISLLATKECKEYEVSYTVSQIAAAIALEQVAGEMRSSVAKEYNNNGTR